MTQNGPHPGQPSQPWSARSGDDGYQAPADPWSESHDGWGGSPASTPPGVAGPVTSTDYDAVAAAASVTGPGSFTSYDAGHAPLPTSSAPPMWGQPPVSPPRRGPGKLIVALVVVLGVLTCAGLGVTGLLVQKANDKKKAAATATPTAAAKPTGNNVGPGPRTSEDARFVAKGQCVRNEGSADIPQMSIVPCATGTFEVLARVDGRTTGEADAESKCAKVPNYTKWYFYDSELDSLDFVLCLREKQY
jgi:hypothetical protein